MCPVNPEAVAIYDYLPEPVLFKVSNLADFFSTFVFDQWTAHADSRQAVFYRPARSLPLRALMIDHGFIFQNTSWKVDDFKSSRLFYENVYKRTASEDAFQNIYEKILSITEEGLQGIVRPIPLEWFEGDFAELWRLLERLLQRRKRLAEVMQSKIAGWLNLNLGCRTRNMHEVQLCT
jgi:hypothetical protein